MGFAPHHDYMPGAIGLANTHVLIDAHIADPTIHYAVGAIDHNAISNLTVGDPHTQYILHSLATAANDFLVASGSGTYIKKTDDEVADILEGLIDHGNLSGLSTGADHSYIDQDVTTTGSPLFISVQVGGRYVLSNTADRFRIFDDDTAGVILEGTDARIYTGGELDVAGAIQGLSLDLGVAGALTGVLTLDGATSGYVKIQPLDAAGSYTLTLPPDDGSASQFLQTNGSGILDWATVDLSGYLPLTGGTMTGHLLFTDATYDIGASGATRPRNIYASGAITAGGVCTFGVGGSQVIIDAGEITADGDVTCKNLSASSTTYPVIDIERDSLTVGTDIYAGARLRRIMTGGTALDNSGIGFFFDSPNDAGNSQFTGMFGGALADVSAGSEIGTVIFASSWQGANPAGSNHLQILSMSASTANVIVPAGKLLVGDGLTNAANLSTSLVHFDGNTGSTFITVHDRRSTTGDVAGIKFATIVVGQNAKAKSMILHKETGAWGIGDMIFCVDPTGDNAEVVQADEVMRIASTGAITMQQTLGITGVTTLDSTLFIKETASGGSADVAGYGQLYCKDNSGTTELWFVNDAGTETQLA